jgi:pyruvate dehydrogenase E1 component alpha subunit
VNAADSAGSIHLHLRWLIKRSEKRFYMTEVQLENGMPAVSADLLARMLDLMYTIRAFEEKAEELYALGKIHGTMHLSIGMEASAVGSVLALEPQDLILSTHRGHGHCIAKGADLRLMMAEFMGKECGYCRGRGGSMHIADVEGGNLGANGVVAGGIPIAVGVGLGIKMQKKDQVILSFFGDGAANSGAFHEALNMAAIYNLPAVFVCENNQYAMSFPAEKAFKVPEISIRAQGYGMPGETVDGNNVLDVYRAVSAAVQRAHAGQGPSLVENVTYRWRGHSKSDANRYRTRDEIETWQEKDPIPRLARRMQAEDLLDEDGLQAVRERAYAAIEAAVAYAEACDEPDLATIEEGVYA